MLFDLSIQMVSCPLILSKNQNFFNFNRKSFIHLKKYYFCSGFPNLRFEVFKLKICKTLVSVGSYCSEATLQPCSNYFPLKQSANSENTNLLLKMQLRPVLKGCSMKSETKGRTSEKLKDQKAYDCEDIHCCVFSTPFGILGSHFRIWRWASTENWLEKSARGSSSIISDLSLSSWNDCPPFMHRDLFAVVSTQVLGSLKKKPQRRLGRLPDCGCMGRDSSGSLGWVGWLGSRLARRFQQLILSDRFPAGKHSHRPPLMLCKTNHTTTPSD